MNVHWRFIGLMNMFLGFAALLAIGLVVSITPVTMWATMYPILIGIFLVFILVVILKKPPVKRAVMLMVTGLFIIVVGVGGAGESEKAREFLKYPLWIGGSFFGLGVVMFYFVYRTEPVEVEYDSDGAK